MLTPEKIQRLNSVRDLSKTPKDQTGVVTKVKGLNTKVKKTRLVGARSARKGIKPQSEVPECKEAAASMMVCVVAENKPTPVTWQRSSGLL